MTLTPVLSILMTTFHLTDGIVRGISAGGLSNLPVVLVPVVRLYAALVLPERRSGHVIILVASLLAAGLPVVHMTNNGGAVGGGLAARSGARLFAWTLIALGPTAAFQFNPIRSRRDREPI